MSDQARPVRISTEQEDSRVEAKVAPAGRGAGSEPAPAVVEETDATRSTEESPTVKVGSGSVTLRYLGPTDYFRYGDHQFRRGVTVSGLSKSVAEELLTYPDARFEEVKE